MPEFESKVTFVDVVCLKQTTKALLCEINGKQVWIPHSQVDDDSEVYREGDEGKLIVSEWIANEKKLI